MKTQHKESHWISLSRQSNDNLSIFTGVPALSGRIAGQFAFGGREFKDAAVTLMGGTQWPLMWLQGDPDSGKHVSGTQALVIPETPIRPLLLAGIPVGSTWSDGDADYCFIAGLQPDNPHASRAEQAKRVFELTENVLQQAGMTFLNVARTWLFMDQLLDWYDEFNTVRTAFFTERGVFDHFVPASTGIGARNPAGTALVVGALAVRPKRPSVTLDEVTSPLQCPATAYRSSFSRAVELTFTHRRQLLISGTASIAPSGETVHATDVRAQIALTMKVVKAILESRGMDWTHATRGLAYFRDMGDANLLDRYCRENGLPQLPVVPVHATVCRHDLLFELELDAEQAR